MYAWNAKFKKDLIGVSFWNALSQKFGVLFDKVMTIAMIINAFFLIAFLQSFVTKHQLSKQSMIA